MATRRRANGAGIHFYYEGTSFEGHIELNIALALRRDGWNGSSWPRRLMWDQGRLATWRDFISVSEGSAQEFLLNIQCGISRRKQRFPCWYKVYKRVSASIVDGRAVRISDARGAWGSQLDQDRHLIPLNLFIFTRVMEHIWWLRTGGF